jgi:Co/Zn/Cd efflux system component
MPDGRGQDISLRRAVTVVAVANLAYFFVEFSTAYTIDSVSLFADSIDFLEDATLNLLIAAAVGWSLRSRALLGHLLAAIICIPGFATLWMTLQKVMAPTPPEPWLLSATGLGALAVNVGCALLLARYRSASGSLTRAAYLSARNDALANIAIIGAGVMTLKTLSGWPDLIVGLGIAAMNADAAAKIWSAAAAEHRAAEP